MKTLVGIPTLNGPERLRRCLHALGGCTPFHEVQVLVADDGSTPENLEQNRRLVYEMERGPIRGLEMLFGHGRTGIARTWNRLVRHVPDAEIVLLLNDDIEVMPDWLEVLRYSLAENPHAGMVGLNCYSGLSHGQAVKEGRVPPRPDYVEATLLGGDGGLVSSFGPIFGFRRAVWEAVGGFDEQYFCFYEEVDFGISLAREGLYHYMASYPIVYHLGGATNSDPKNLDARQHLAESQARFAAKWGQTLGQLREELLARGPGPRPRQWNQQVKVWP